MKKLLLILVLAGIAFAGWPGWPVAYYSSDSTITNFLRAKSGGAITFGDTVKMGVPWIIPTGALRIWNDSILFGIPIAGVPRAAMYWSTANNNVRISQNLISEGTLSGNSLGTAWAQYFIGGGDNTWFIRRSTTGDTLHLFLDSTQVVSIINSVRVKKDSLSSTVGCYTKWMSPTDTTLITPIKVQTDVFQGNIRTFAVAGTSDTVSVAKASVMAVNTAGGSITIGGFIGGVAGQILHLYNSGANNVTLEDDEATGNQDIKSASAADITITAEGGATLLCDGSLWWIIGIAQ